MDNDFEDDFGIEISPSNRGNCRGCGDKIPKGVPRLWVKGPLFQNHRQHLLYCMFCGLERIEDIQTQTNKITIKLKEAIGTERIKENEVFK